MGGNALWPLIARSTAHSRPLPPDGEREQRQRGVAGEATCRRWSTAARVQGGGGGLGRLGDGAYDVGEGLARRVGEMVTDGMAPGSSCSAAVLRSPGGARRSGE